MNARKVLCFIGLLLALTFFLPCNKWSQLFPYTGGGRPKPGTHAPVITHAFAMDKGYYGYVWKIYIEAEDPDGRCSELPLWWTRRVSVATRPIGFISNPNTKNILEATFNGTPSV